MHLESLEATEVAVRNAMVQNAANNKLYTTLAQMQRKLLELVRDARQAEYENRPLDK